MVNQVNILSWVQVAGKYGFEILDPCANKLNVIGDIVFSNKMFYETLRAKVGFGRSAILQYLVYSVLGNIP